MLLPWQLFFLSVFTELLAFVLIADALHTIRYCVLAKTYIFLARKGYDIKKEDLAKKLNKEDK